MASDKLLSWVLGNVKMFVRFSSAAIKTLQGASVRTLRPGALCLSLPPSSAALIIHSFLRGSKSIEISSVGRSWVAG